MSWERFKETKLKKFDDHLKEKKVDELIINLLNKINKNKDLVTTSSCAGRIVLLEFDIAEGKKTARFFRKWHRKIRESEIIAALDEYKKYKNRKQLWFKVEPLIMHVAAKNVASAKKFLEEIRKVGIKRGGIQSITKEKVMIEIQGNSVMVFPVNAYTNWKVIVKLANEMFERNLKTLKKLEKIKWQAISSQNQPL
jgi:tRNA wybutosine-synthesizing protein 3